MWAHATHKYLNVHKVDVIRPVKSRCTHPTWLYLNVVIKQTFLCVSCVNLLPPALWSGLQRRNLAERDKERDPQWPLHRSHCRAGSHSRLSLLHCGLYFLQRRLHFGCRQDTQQNTRYPAALPAWNKHNLTRPLNWHKLSLFLSKTTCWVGQNFA